MITGKTKLLGVIGYPVGHSLSPVMHNAAIAHLGLDYVYLPLPIEPQNLEGLAAVGVVGFSVTIPHKQAIIPLLSEITPLAQAIGAVNTVSRKNNQWVGTNTDIIGFIHPLQTTYKQDWSQKIAVILGNGGAARAVVAGCHQLGFAEIHVVGRNLEKLTDFQQSWEYSPIADTLQIHTWDKLTQLIPQADLLVNTTPIGMYPNVDDSPVSLDDMTNLQLGAMTSGRSLAKPLGEKTIAYDLIYIPQPTKFLQYAQQQGVIAIDGLEMLVQQGVAALKIWLQQDDIPVDVMRQALKKQLGLG
jgi:shikimate dehydrogenase